MATKHLFYNGTATTDEQNTTINTPEIYMIANDDDTNDLYLSFDASIDDGNYITVKPEEILEGFEALSCKVLYFKSSAGSVNFRVNGKKVN